MQMSKAQFLDNSFQIFQHINSRLASLVEIECCLKPEVAILMNLYEAEECGRLLSASSVGLSAGIPPSSAIRYLRYLEERGWVIRKPHPTDKRVHEVRISPGLFHKMRGFLARQVSLTASASYKPTV